MHRRERRCITLLFRFFFEVVDDVADSDETAYIVLVDLDVEFLFAQKDEIGELERIDSEVSDEFRFGSYVVFVD